MFYSTHENGGEKASVSLCGLRSHGLMHVTSECISRIKDSRNEVLSPIQMGHLSFDPLSNGSFFFCSDPDVMTTWCACMHDLIPGVQCRLHLRDVAVSMYDMTEWH